MADPFNGILLVDKEEGQTSYSAVRKVKRAMGVRKVGHGGTLDPFATGLLIILLGQGTKLSPFLMSEVKKYYGVARLGVETDTLDATGRVVRSTAVPKISVEQIREKAALLTGEIEQTPPAYSAVKCNGRRAYEMARKGLVPRLGKRKRIVHSFYILDVDLPDIAIEVNCSKGTYVRSLAAEMGRELGTGAHLRSLRRLAIGDFTVENAVKSSLICSIECGHLKARIIPLRHALPLMPEIELDERLARKIRHGYQPAPEELFHGDRVNGTEHRQVKAVKDQELVAILEVGMCNSLNGFGIKLKRVFT